MPKEVKNLEFYNRPFKIDYGGSWVWDARENFVFQFEKSIPKSDREKIIFRLNALDKETEDIPDYNLIYATNNTEIYNKGELFITIRGWGNLTGTGAHNFDVEKASRIQDNFAEWLIEKLTNKK